MSLLPVSKPGGGGANEVFVPPADSLATVLNRHHFYAGAYRTLVRISLVMAFVLILLILGSCLVILLASPNDRFFTASVDGRVSRLMPLDTPNVALPELADYVSTAITRAVTYGYLDYEERRAENFSPFSPVAFQKLQDIVLGTGGIDKVNSSMLILRGALPENTGVGLVRAGINSYFTYEWVLQVPLQVTIESDLDDGPPEKKAWILHVLVERSADVEVRSGFIISDILGAQPWEMSVQPGARSPQGGAS